MILTESKTQHLSDWKLHRHLRGLLTGDEGQQTKAHVNGCARCRAALEQLGTAESEFAASVFPRTVGAVVDRAQAAGFGGLMPFVKRWWAALALPALAIGSAGFMLWARPPQGDAESADLRTKGGAQDVATDGPQLRIHRKRNGAVSLLDPGRDTLAPLDELRFGVHRVANLPYLMIASLDTSGNAAIYFPYEGQHSELMPGSGSWFDAPGSVVLDKTLGAERVFALLSSTPLAAAHVKAALATIAKTGPLGLRNTPSLNVPAQAQSSVLFEKQSP